MQEMDNKDGETLDAEDVDNNLPLLCVLTVLFLPSFILFFFSSSSVLVAPQFAVEHVLEDLVRPLLVLLDRPEKVLLLREIRWGWKWGKFEASHKGV